MEVEVRAALQADGSCAVQGPRDLYSAAAPVPVSREDAEASVLGQKQWEGVRERRARGQSISAIARELDVDRKTVRSCLRQPVWQPYRRAEAGGLLDAHREWLAGAGAGGQLFSAHPVAGVAVATRVRRQLM